MEKLRTSKTFSKMVGGRMHTPHPTRLDPPLAIRCKNFQKSPAYFSHLAPLILFFFTKRQGQKRLPLNTLLTALHLFRDIGKESTIAFSVIDKIVALFLNSEKAERKIYSTLLLSESQAKGNGL